jgi:hypothetical protein
MSQEVSRPLEDLAAVLALQLVRGAVFDCQMLLQLPFLQQKFSFQTLVQNLESNLP